MPADKKFTLLLKGLKFGMILQFAIGPVFMYILGLGSSEGFFSAEKAVFAVTLVDFVFVLLAILGITSFIKDKKIQNYFNSIGALIVGCFGLNIVIGALGIKLIPNIDFFGVAKFGSTFADGLLLTATNPLTIFVWAGVFSTEITEGKMKNADVYFFGIGAVMATLVFLSTVAILGSIIKLIIPAVAIKGLNIFVGIILVYFAFNKIKLQTITSP